MDDPSARSWACHALRFYFPFGNIPRRSRDPYPFGFSRVLLTHSRIASSTVSIHNLHGNGLPEDRCGRELLGSLAERLALFRAVNAVQPDALALAVVQDRDRVAIGDAHHAASEVGGEGG